MLPRSGVIVDIALRGDLAFAEEKREAVRFPRPPPPPAGRTVSTMADLYGMFNFQAPSLRLPEPYLPALNMMNMIQPSRRDRYAFYPEERDPGSLGWTCDELRHHGPEQLFELTLSGSRGALEYQVSASNAPAPVKGIIPVRFTPVTRDTAAAARETIRQSIEVPRGVLRS